MRHSMASTTLGEHHHVALAIFNQPCAHPRWVLNGCGDLCLEPCCRPREDRECCGQTVPRPGAWSGRVGEGSCGTGPGRQAVVPALPRCHAAWRGDLVHREDG